MYGDVRKTAHPGGIIHVTKMRSQTLSSPNAGSVSSSVVSAPPPRNALERKTPRVPYKKQRQCQSMWMPDNFSIGELTELFPEFSNEVFF